MIRPTILCAALGLALIAGGAMATDTPPQGAFHPAPAVQPTRLSPLLQRLAGSRLENCIVCCSRRQAECYKAQPREGCDVQFNNCVATCNSQGSTPSSWGPACWAGSNG